MRWIAALLLLFAAGITAVPDDPTPTNTDGESLVRGVEERYTTVDNLFLKYTAEERFDIKHEPYADYQISARVGGATRFCLDCTGTHHLFDMYGDVRSRAVSDGSALFVERQSSTSLCSLPEKLGAEVRRLLVYRGVVTTLSVVRKQAGLEGFRASGFTYEGQETREGRELQVVTFQVEAPGLEGGKEETQRVWIEPDSRVIMRRVVLKPSRDVIVETTSSLDFDGVPPEGSFTLPPK